MNVDAEYMRGLAYSRRVDAMEYDRVADEALALARRVRELFAANLDLAATTCGVTGFSWRVEGGVHVVAAFDEHGRPCFEQREESFDDGLRAVFCAIVAWNRTEAAKAREEADDHLIEAMSFETDDDAHAA